MPVASNQVFFETLKPENQIGRLVFITAGGGFGKSFLVDNLKRTQPELFSAFKFTKYGTEWSIPDLIVHQGPSRITLNSLLNIPDQRVADLLKEINDHVLSAANPIVLVDDFDEIDPLAAKKLLTQLSAIAEHPDAKRRIIGVGRPEAFSAFMSDPRRPFTTPPCHRSPQNAPPVVTSKCTTSDDGFLGDGG